MKLNGAPQTKKYKYLRDIFFLKFNILVIGEIKTTLNFLSYSSQNIEDKNSNKNQMRNSPQKQNQ